MQLLTIFVLFATFSWRNLAESANLNTDFVSPEELEALLNKASKPTKIPQFGSMKNPQVVPIGVPQKPFLAKPFGTPVVPAVLPNNQLTSRLPFEQDNDDRPIWGSSNSVSSSNAGSQAINKHGGQEQTAGANTYNHNEVNEHGISHNSGGSSISSNIDETGSKGNVATSNTQKQMTQNAHGSSLQESSMSQSANFDKNAGTLQATNANTDKKHTIDATGEKLQQSAGSSATNQDKHGTGSSSAQTNQEEYNVNGVKGSKTGSSAISSQINKDGNAANANANSESNTYEAPDGTKVTEHKAGATSVSQGANGNSGSSSGCGAGGATNQQQGQNLGGGWSSSSSSSSSSSTFTNGQGQTVSQSECGTKTANGPGGLQQFFPQFNQGFGQGQQQQLPGQFVQYPYPYIARSPYPVG